MKNIKDGVIKYDNSQFIQTAPIEPTEYGETEENRKILYRIRLVGCYEKDQIGYGNISCKQNYTHLHATNKPQFLITGSQTGHLANLTGAHYTRVVDYDINLFKIVTHGPIKASSESLTHGAIYEADDHIRAVIHIHSKEIWSGMIKDGLPSTAQDIPYGTKEMAMAVKKVIHQSDQNFLAMQGHEEGVVIYGENLKQAMKQTIYLYQKYIDSSFSL